MSTDTVKTFCRVCEPACGLVATVKDGRLADLAPDRDHPITKGFACPKGLAGVDIHHDPDRLAHPLRRSPDGGWSAVSWDEAMAGISTSLRRIIDKHGVESVASYIGNPTAFNTLAGPAAGAFLAQLGVRRHFSSGTQDCANKFAGSEAVFGSSTMHPIPDIEHTDCMLIFGANPRVSKGSFISIAHPMKALMAAHRRGAKIFHINPRRTESVGDASGELVQIRPDTDVFLLAALLCELDRMGLWDAEVCAEHGSGVTELRAFVRQYPAERVAGVCGIDAEMIRTVAETFGRARAASTHMSTGVNMTRHGTLAYWLMHMLVFVTANLDREGGNILSRGFYPSAKAGKRDFESAFTDSPFGDMRRGALPGTLMSNYILDADPPVRALIVAAGNPLLSIAGEDRLREAFEQLELLVCVDLYRNATGEYADWLLPATDQFERADINITGLGLQYEPWVQWTPPVVAARDERKPEWWIFARLSQEMGFRSLLDGSDGGGAQAEQVAWSRIDHMLASRGHSLDDVRAAPYGISFPDGRQPGMFYDEHIQTKDGRVDCFPSGFAGALAGLEGDFAALTSEPGDQLKLISRRDSRMHNSWYANVRSMKRGARDRNRLSVHPFDAERLGLVAGAFVSVRNEFGEIAAIVDIDDAVRPGVVAMEHGWGHQPGMTFTSKTPGVNVNSLLPYGPGSFDPLSNQAHMTGIPVTVSALPAAG